MDMGGIFDSLVTGQNNNPFAWLGMGQRGDAVWVRVFRPAAEYVILQSADGLKDYGMMRKVHKDGIFEIHIPSHAPFFWRLKLKENGQEKTVFDAYAFGSNWSDTDRWLFAEGNHFNAYKILGAHPQTVENVEGVRFAVWAPNARRVSVVGDFNHWDGRMHVMRCHQSVGVWEIFIPHVKQGDIYKYEIIAQDGNRLPLKADPYGFAGEYRPKTASIVQGLGHYDWQDNHWMEKRHLKHNATSPIAVYEVHAPSWARVPEEGNRPLNWRELAEKLIPYVIEQGFTHIELLPISEYPFDGSWGYQPIGLFAPTSRLGSADDFRYFIDYAHQHDIGILIDWVPAHFPEDEHGLALFDGTHLFEHEDPRQGRHQDWGTLIYNFGRMEVCNFLISNALYWLREFHIDGLRVDAVASMLYLNYSRKEGEWVPNKFGGQENLEAIAFLKKLNETIYLEFPDVMTIAEESTSWGGVSHPTFNGGLGFGFKWNMGWMNDSLLYIKKDPIHRSYHQNDLTFSLIYAFSENFILPISHDEVVHGKGSLLGRMPGDRWQQFANMRNFLAYMYGHPGKKLLFMGCEIAQSREWDFESSVDWHLLERPEHKAMQKLTADLNRLYTQNPALYQRDCEGAGFAWIDASDSEKSVLAWRRIGHDGSEFTFVSNFTPSVHHDYKIGVAHDGKWLEVFNTDSHIYGGSNQGNHGAIWAQNGMSHGLDYHIHLTLPPLATIVLKKEV